MGWERALSTPCAGLLLHNLSVYRGCEVLFDSLEVPEEAIDEADQRDAPNVMVGWSKEAPSSRRQPGVLRSLHVHLEDMLGCFFQQQAEAHAAHAGQSLTQVSDHSVSPSAHQPRQPVVAGNPVASMRDLILKAVCR